VRLVLAPSTSAGYTRPMRRTSAPATSRPSRPLRSAPRVALVALLAIAGGAFGAKHGVAQPRERVDSTLPPLQSPQRGERVLGTGAQRAAAESALRDELARQAELDAQFNPHRAAWSGGSMPIYPTVLPCPAHACPPRKPSPRPDGGTLADPSRRPHP
jgi:hypothetical protein